MVADIAKEDSRQSDEVTTRRLIRRWCLHRLVRFVMISHCLAVAVAGVVGRCLPRPDRRDGLEILMTGTFHAENWIVAHIRPLANAESVRRLTVVTTYAMRPLPKIEVICPPQWLQRTLGRVPARLLVYIMVAILRRPDVVGGYHLLVNGLLAAVVARLVRARAMYVCNGGPNEIIGGGVNAENRLFGLMETPDPVVERRLIGVLSQFDLLIAKGHGARKFFDSHRLPGAVHVIEGGIDSSKFKPVEVHAEYDIILIGRLAPIKRIDVFLAAVRLVAHRLPEVKAAIVGDGSLWEELESQARQLGIQDRVTFAGHQKDVGQWLAKSRLFVLTSDSEGLALSLMEAMTCGVPAVVSNVGDLGDLLEDGVNGYLVNERTPEAFADRITELLADENRRRRFAAAARHAAERLEVSVISGKWDRILSPLRSG